MTTETQKQNLITLRTDNQNLKQKITYACTNTIYKLGIIGGFKKVSNFLCKDARKKQIVILGEHFDQEQKSEAQAKFKKIIWFTYRKNIQITDELNSDVGWGCLLRVGQMVLAEALTKFFTYQGLNLDIDLQRKIIQPFIDHLLCQSQYSLNTILKYARWKYAKNPGQWFYISEICDILRKVHDENPLAGTEKLKILYFGQATIFIKEILQKAGFQNPSKISKILSERLMQYNNQLKNQSDNKIKCQILKDNQNKQNIKKMIRKLKIQKEDSFSFIATQDNLYKHENSQNSILFIQNKENICQNLKQRQINNHNYQFDNHVVVFVSAQVGFQNNITQQQFKSIQSILSLKSSLGIIGGVPKKALYIVGTDNDQLVYLDPHYVQEYKQVAELEQINSYFCQNYRTLNYNALDSSMAFCFYLKNTNDLFQLILKIKQEQLFSKQKGGDFFLCVQQKKQFQIQTGCKLKDKNSFEHNSLQFVDIMECMNNYRK